MGTLRRVSDLKLTTAFRALQRSLIADGIDRQQMDRKSRYYGAIIPPESGIDNAHATGYFVTRCGTALAGAALGHELPPGISPELLLERMRLGLDSLVRFQRPSGLIDLRSANYDSAPDTAFVVQALSLLIYFDRIVTPPDAWNEGWRAVIAQVTRFVVSTIPGIIKGGFHTPNHRWVISSALSLASALIPEIITPDLDECVESYLAEGFDNDEEGAFLERSAGAYDVINTRSLLILAATWRRDVAAQVYRSVAANLDFNAHLLHDDGTIETGLSHRQDYGVRKKAVGLVPSYLELAAATGEGRYRAVAEFIWERSDPGNAFELYYHDIYWLIAVLIRRDIPALPETPMETEFSRYYPMNQIWRVRRGQLSATVFGEGKHNFFSLVNGRATLFGVSISQTYFGRSTGRFLPRISAVEQGRASLVSEGDGGGHRPGYDLPLGRPVSRDSWEAELSQRAVYQLPQARSTVEVAELESPEHGFALHYVSKAGLNDVLTQIFFDFPLGGIWETNDTAFAPLDGQILFLKSGSGRMRFATDCVEIGPGSAEHQIFRLRNSDPVPDGYCRVIVSLLTPIDYRFYIRALNDVVM